MLWTDWAARWPNADASRFVEAAHLRWHVQSRGTGPTILLLHGTGGATHSWEALLPALAADHHVIAPDLPGHGFTQSPGVGAITLRDYARLIGELLRTLGASPDVVVGHSAGAAVALQMAVDGALPPHVRLVGINPALRPPRLAGLPLWDALTAVLRAPAVLALVARAARSRALIESLLGSTGSVLSPAQMERYVACFADAAHAGSAFAMTANWDLAPLRAALRTVRHPTTFILGDRDRWVPPEDALEAAAGMPHCEVRHLTDAGHLVAEERPAEVAALIRGALQAPLAPHPAASE